MLYLWHYCPNHYQFRTFFLLNNPGSIRGKKVFTSGEVNNFFYQTFYSSVECLFLHVRPGETWLRLRSWPRSSPSWLFFFFFLSLLLSFYMMFTSYLFCLLYFFPILSLSYLNSVFSLLGNFYLPLCLSFLFLLCLCYFCVSNVFWYYIYILIGSHLLSSQ